MNPFSVADESDESDESDGSDDLQKVFTRTPPATLRAFALVSLLVQVGLFAGSLGLLLVVFRDQWTLGAALAGGGATALALAVFVYRRYRAARERRTEGEAG